MAVRDARSPDPAGERRPRRGVKPAVLAGTAGAVFAVAGCGEVGPPEITIYSDGEAIQVEPFTYCDVEVTECDNDETHEYALPTRPGQPAQISVPGEIAETPWLVNVQAADADGTPLPVQQEYFSPGEAHAFTAEPPSPDATLLIVEVQQMGAAFAADQEGEPIRDEEGAMQPVTRGIWPVAFEARS
ncbi:DUF2771 family protein [Haloechinothrix sp. YIM 98757]|uniref:DUF2771 family protein n=1 Tax=Haloechinothrix aidingensis TaxID=2752311 RepID=A0A838AEG4_9PSEU|nr:DUF2771 family protein [Haloechinothrix aidingensis]MBA0127696.1 DUF2771 family protein [Haloechinothrix aidingensis]